MNNIVYVAPADDWLSHRILRIHQLGEIFVWGLVGLSILSLIGVVFYTLFMHYMMPRIYKFFKLERKK
jgi:hypothetical protein